MSAISQTPPTWDVPFRLNRDGTVAEVPQGSVNDVGNQIYNVLTCPQGAALNKPDFGIPSPLFGTVPLNLTGVVKAVQRLVPTASVEAVQQALEQLQQPQSVVAVTGTVQS
jgi:hypothetical protein